MADPSLSTSRQKLSSPRVDFLLSEPQRSSSTDSFSTPRSSIDFKLHLSENTPQKLIFIFQQVAKGYFNIAFSHLATLSVCIEEDNELVKPFINSLDILIKLKALSVECREPFITLQNHAKTNPIISNQLETANDRKLFSTTTATEGISQLTKWLQDKTLEHQDNLILTTLKKPSNEHPEKTFLNHSFRFFAEESSILIEKQKKKLLYRYLQIIYLNPTIRMIKKEDRIFEAIKLGKDFEGKTEFLAQQLEKKLSKSPFTLKHLFFFLNIINGNVKKSETNLYHVAAGIRAWDLDGKIFTYSLSRLSFLVKDAPDLIKIPIRRWFQFLNVWKAAPFNKLHFMSERKKWDKLVPSIVEIYPDLPEEAPLIEVMNDQFNIMPIKSENSGLAQDVAEPQKLANTIICYLAENWLKGHLHKDLLNYDNKEGLFSKQCERAQQITLYICTSILYANDFEHAKAAIKLICKTQKLCIKANAFEAAHAIHMGMSLAPLDRLKKVYESIRDCEVFNDSDSFAQINYPKTRKKQEDAPFTLEVTTLLKADLTKTNEGNPVDILPNGIFNFKKFELLGKLYNQSVVRQQAARKEIPALTCNPDISLLNTFSTIPSKITDFIDNRLWKRSYEIKKEGGNEITWIPPGKKTLLNFL